MLKRNRPEELDVPRAVVYKSNDHSDLKNPQT
jgi:hypothetical protein